ncbi:hypothetical protein PRZ48_002935 [Zasmidium cellare]|uniref:Zn(2)-C6 fungal-type domain-containing protein n=1 Tax=Zasmidium cellare TaxID=395010 RepID=A0ABR0ETS8_ZASCE|nr:hypothetical protein PRZ48_002935 [Zasmidium cellare]
MTTIAKNPRTGPDHAANGKRSRPCDACRRRKSKCVTEEGQTICVLCAFHNQECLYLEAPQPRKRALPSGTTDAQSPSKRSRTILIKPGTGVEEYDTLPGPSLLKRTLGLQNRHHSEYVGPNAIPDVYSGLPTDGASNNTHESNKPSADYVRFVHPLAAFRIIPDASTSGWDQERDDIDEIESTAQGHGAELVELFFRIVHPSFPVLHKDVFLEKYERSYREFSPPLLAAVYLLASGYWSYSESLQKARRIDAVALQTLAFNALQNTMRRPKLSTLQAGLLLSQYQKAFMGAVPNEQRDRLTVQLVNLAHSLGLHLDCSNWDIPDWEIGLRRRIGWALFMQDKWSALLESRPSLIIHDDWDVRDLSEDDFPENMEDDLEGSSEVVRGRLVFTHMAHLSVILSEILRLVFSSRARRLIDSTPDKLTVLLEQVKPLQIRLKDWFSTLPESLKMDTAASMKLSSVGYLRLQYLTVEVCIHRNLIRTLVSTELPNPTAAHACRAAANERFVNAIDFVQRLQAQHLASFWYFASAKCCALIHAFGQVLETTAQTEEEKAFYTRKLKEFKFALKVNSEAGASFMKQALALINHSIRITSQPFDPGSNMTSPASVGVLPQAAEASPEQPQTQWVPNNMMENGNLPYGAFHGDYSALDNAIFPDTDAMFSQFQNDLDGTWLSGLS